MDMPLAARELPLNVLADIQLASMEAELADLNETLLALHDAHFAIPHNSGHPGRARLTQRINVLAKRYFDLQDALRKAGSHKARARVDLLATWQDIQADTEALRAADDAGLLTGEEADEGWELISERRARLATRDAHTLGDVWAKIQLALFLEQADGSDEPGPLDTESILASFAPLIERLAIAERAASGARL